jgi:hypothetical protein
MATLPQTVPPQETNEVAEMDALVNELFELKEKQLATMTPERREEVLADIHATAERLRATQ